MPVFLLFVAYLGGALVLAAVLFYPLYSLLSAIPDLPYHKILSRSAMLFAAIGLIFFLRRLKLANRDDLGYGLPRRRFLRVMGLGWLAGVLSMLVPFVLLDLLGVRELRPGGIDMGRILDAARSGLIGGFAVAFIEETFFRGALYSGIRRNAGVWSAAVLSSLLFASLHFIRPRAFPEDTVIDWSSGFTLLAGAFDAYSGGALWDSFVALFAVGVLLTLLRAWQGNIALAIGVHAGWVMVIKVGKTLTQKDDDAPLAFLSGSYDGVIGWLVTAYLVLMVLAVLRPAMRNAGRT